MTTRRWLALAAFAALVLLGGRLVAALVVDHRWHASLGPGALAVWRARLTELVALRTLLTLAGAGFVFANLYGVVTSVESLVLPRRLGDLEIGEKVPGRQLLWAAGLVAVVAGLLLSFLVDDWMAFDLVQFGRPFGASEPYTSTDLAFFVAWLPFEAELYGWAIAALVATTALTSVLYALTTGLRWEQGKLRTTRHVRRHLMLLAAALLLVLAWGHRLDAYSLLSAGSGPDGAFVYADHMVALRARFALASLTAVAALLVLIAGWQSHGRLAFWVVTVVLVVTLVLRGLVPALGARGANVATVRQRNEPYFRNRAAVTQNAYAVNRIRRAPAYGFPSADSAALAVPLWDPAVLARAIERERRGEIVGDEIGWQPVGGRLGAVAVTRPAPPPDGEPVSWGVLVAAGALADPTGDPVLLDASGAPAPGITLPEAAGRERRLIVFPQATGYVVVSDTTGRLAADPIDTFSSRLAHAWNERDFRLLFADEIDRMERPAIVRRRGVRERVAAVAPFFVQGHAITPLVARDTLYWISHLYAASPTFPLSQRYDVGGQPWGYFQHAAVAVVNGESGAVTLLPVTDPGRLTAAWVRRFPSLFATAAALPPELVAALPPPTDGVLLQAWALSQYGSRAGIVAPGPVHLPGGDGGDSTLGVAARALALLPASDGEPRAPGWTLPLLDSSDRVAGVLVAIGGRAPTTLWVPNAEVGPRWGEVVERLRGGAVAAERVGEDAPARETTRGRVRAVPVAGRLAYVQPMYAGRGAAGGQATATGVAVLVADSLRIGRTIAEALGGAPAAVTGGMDVPAGGEGRARALYESMQAALRRGDWAAFGAAFDSLGAVLRWLDRAPDRR